MKSTVTIDEYETRYGFRFIVKDLGYVIEIINDTKYKRGKKSAMDAADQYRELVLDNKEDPLPKSSFVCSICGIPTVKIYYTGQLYQKVCENCAKRTQGQTHTDDDEARFDDLMSRLE